MLRRQIPVRLWQASGDTPATVDGRKKQRWWMSKPHKQQSDKHVVRDDLRVYVFLPPPPQPDGKTKKFDIFFVVFFFGKRDPHREYVICYFPAHNIRSRVYIFSLEKKGGNCNDFVKIRITGRSRQGPAIWQKSFFLFSSTHRDRFTPGVLYVCLYRPTMS